MITGVAFACLSTSLGGMTVALTRLIIIQTEPLSLAFLRYGIGAIVLFGIILAKFRFPRIDIRDLVGLTVLGVVMFAGFPYCMARSLEETTAARGALVFATMPMVTIILGAIFRVERLTWAKMLAVGVAILGTAITLGESVDIVAPNAFRGDLYMFLGTVAASSFNIFSRKYLIRYGTLPTLVYTMLIGVLVLFLLALAYEQPLNGSLNFDLDGWFVIFMLAVPGGALMMFSWARALQLISPTQATITIGLNPLTAILLGAWLLAEPVTLNVLAGTALILVAIILANWQPKSLE